MMQDPQVVVQSLTPEEIHELKGEDLLEIKAVLFLKKPSFGKIMDVVRVHSPKDIRAEHRLKIPQLVVSKYSSLIHYIDYIGDAVTAQSHGIVDYQGDLTPAVKSIAERFAAVLRKDRICGGACFPGYFSRGHITIRILGTANVPHGITNIRLVRAQKIALFAQDATIYTISISDMVSGNWDEKKVIRTPDKSPVLFIDRIVRNPKIRITTEDGIYLLNINTGKVERIKTQPAKIEEKTIAYFSGAAFATKLLDGGKTIALDPFYAPTGL